jgi:hypothetical protein
MRTFSAASKFADTVLRSRRINNGEYVVNDRYFVARIIGGTEWQWRDGIKADVRGAWQPTKAAAMTDLQAHFDAPRKALRPDWNWK